MGVCPTGPCFSGYSVAGSGSLLGLPFATHSVLHFYGENFLEAQRDIVGAVWCIYAWSQDSTSTSCGAAANSELQSPALTKVN